MVVSSSETVSSKRLRQSSRALCSSLSSFGRFLRRPLQLEADNVTSYIVWFTTERIICGRLYYGASEKIPPSELMDTTGAGDAFVGAVLYGTCNLFILPLHMLVGIF